MKHTATLKTTSKDAKSMAKSLEIDNCSLEGLSIKSNSSQNEVTTRIESNSIATLLNTIDDVLCCQMVAEKVIE